MTDSATVEESSMDSSVSDSSEVSQDLSQSQEDDSQLLSSSSANFAILPERQAKVATLVSMIEKTEKDKDGHHKEKGSGGQKEKGSGSRIEHRLHKGGSRGPMRMATEGDEEPQVYCLCRSSDCTKFMIACDHCEEWYHGRCVNVEEAAAKYILKYACPTCRVQDPSLSIVYKERKEKKEKPKVENTEIKVKKKKKKKQLLKEKKMKMKMKMKKKEKEREREKRRKKLKLMKKKKSGSVSERTGASEADASGDYSPAAMGHKLNKAAQRANRRCGECEACNRKEDCGKCDFCLDMKKFGGPNKIRQKCRLKQCLNRASRSFLKPNPHKIRHPGEHRRYDSATSMDTDTDASQQGPAAPFTHVYSYHDYAMRPEMDPVAIKHQQDEEHEKRRKEKKARIAEKKARLAEKAAKKKQIKKEKERKKKQKQEEKKKLKKKVKVKKVERELRKRTADGSVKQTKQEAADLKDLKQCYGPGCIRPARSFSKYCSEECGLKLATNRIFELLPQRIQQWQQSPCIAEENNKKSLEGMRSEMEKVKHKIAELDAKIVKLQSILVHAKKVPIKKQEDSTDNEEEAEASINCVTCGHSINPTKALMHMNKCFRKYESQTSYGSAYKTRIVGESMFCDYFNAQQSTYCKRLKVLCPEHTKEPKVGEKEVCGCPLVRDVFKDTGQYCSLPKRKCTRHHNWEKLRRAEIDLERVRWWLRLDDLLEQERNIRTAMANRAGVLGLMLHQTIDHSLMRPQVPQQQQTAESTG